jgi:hypothetical protein
MTYVNDQRLIVRAVNETRAAVKSRGFWVVTALMIYVAFVVWVCVQIKS